MVSRLARSQELGWITDVPQDLRHALLDVATVRRFDVQRTVYTFGTETRDLWGVVTGSVRLHIATHEHEPRLGHLAGPGFWFGEYALLTGHGRLVELQTAEPCTIVCIPASHFDRIAQARPDVWKWIAVLAAQHTLLALGASDDLMLRGLMPRAAATLLRLAGRRNGHPKALPIDRLVLTQHDLSDVFNMSLSASGRVIRKMSEMGLISLGYGSVEILDPEGLARLVVSGDAPSR